MTIAPMLRFVPLQIGFSTGSMHAPDCHKTTRANRIHTPVLIQSMNERLFLQFRQVDFRHSEDL